jgi:hypothetical protein
MVEILCGRTYFRRVINNVTAIRQLAEADHFLKYCIKHGFKGN